jgi:predicted transcriptional regulator
MIALCKEAGLQDPKFRQSRGQFIQILGRRQISTTPEVTGVVGTRLAPSRHQVAILRKCLIENGITALMAIAKRTDRTKFRHQVLNPLIEDGLLEMTIPDKPTSSKQKYRLTEKGRTLLKKQTKQAGGDEK